MIVDGYTANEVIYKWENRTDKGIALNKKTGRLPQYNVTSVGASSHFTMYTAGKKCYCREEKLHLSHLP